MGRKTKITKDMMLQAAYELLDEGGIGAVAIKSIAAKLGCSTQPVSWQFGSMTELKKELYFYAAMKLYGGLPEKMAGREAVEAFFISGVQYIFGAVAHPNVFRFLNVDDPVSTIGEQILGENSIFSLQFNSEAHDLLAQAYNVPREKIAVTVRDIVIYTHGVAVMMMFDNFRTSSEQACRMVYDMGMKLLSETGIKGDFRSFEEIYKEIGGGAEE